MLSVFLCIVPVQAFASDNYKNELLDCAKIESNGKLNTVYDRFSGESITCQEWNNRVRTIYRSKFDYKKVDDIDKYLKERNKGGGNTTKPNTPNPQPNAPSSANRGSSQPQSNPNRTLYAGQGELKGTKPKTITASPDPSASSSPSSSSSSPSAKSDGKSKLYKSQTKERTEAPVPPKPKYEKQGRELNFPLVISILVGTCIILGVLIFFTRKYIFKSVEDTEGDSNDITRNY